MKTEDKPETKPQLKGATVLNQTLNPYQFDLGDEANAIDRHVLTFPAATPRTDRVGSIRASRVDVTAAEVAALVHNKTFGALVKDDVLIVQPQA